MRQPRGGRILSLVDVPDFVGLLELLLVAAALVSLVGAGALVYHLIRPPRKDYAVALGRGLATHPADEGLTSEEAPFVLSNETRSPGWIIQGERAAGPTVVVVHGFADSRYGALTWAPLLLPHASRVVVYDLRGHGESTARVATSGTADVADLLGILGQLDADRVSPGGGGDAARSTRSDVVLFGYSMGAGVAIAAASQAADKRVRGVVADGCYRHWDQPIRRYLRGRGYPSQPFVFLAGLMLRVLVRGFGGFDRRRHAAHLPVPLLVLHGVKDPLCPVASAREIAHAAPRGRFVAFEEGGHLDLAATDPQRYREALARFFTEVTSVGEKKEIQEPS